MSGKESSLVLEFLNFLRIVGLCGWLWFFAWSYLYDWRINNVLFQNVLGMAISLVIVVFAHLRIVKLRAKEQVKPARRRRRPLEAPKVIVHGKPVCFGELKAGLPEKEECQDCSWKEKCK